MDIQGIKTNIIIDTGSDISIANSRYHTAINAPKLTSDNISISGIGGKEIKPTGFFFHKFYVDGIEIQDKFYVVQEADYDLIIGRKAIEGLTLKVEKDVVRIINDNTVRVGYINPRVVASFFRTLLVVLGHFVAGPHHTENLK